LMFQVVREKRMNCMYQGNAENTRPIRCRALQEVR